MTSFLDLSVSELLQNSQRRLADDSQLILSLGMPALLLSNSENVYDRMSSFQNPLPQDRQTSVEGDGLTALRDWFVLIIRYKRVHTIRIRELETALSHLLL